MFAIQSIGQTVYQQVPDSLVCITPSQDVFNIEQSFTIKEQATSIVLKDKTISILKDESNFLRKESAEKDAEINLRLLQNKHCQDDNKFLTAELHKANRSKRLFKTGFIVSLGLAVTELGIIGFQKWTR